jgi:hypothetical protein
MGTLDVSYSIHTNYLVLRNLVEMITILRIVFVNAKKNQGT